MSNGPFVPGTLPIVSSRIGPIFDPKFLNIFPKDRLKDIVIIQLKAQAVAMQQEMKTIDEIINIVSEAKLG